MADLTAALARLEQLARAVPAESTGPQWWTVETLMRSMNPDHICDEDAAFIEACDPGTILRLVRVARAAGPVLKTFAPYAVYQSWETSTAFQARGAAFSELRAALEELRNP